MYDETWADLVIELVEHRRTEDEFVAAVRPSSCRAIEFLRPSAACR